MIQKVTISYEQDGVNVQLSTEIDPTDREPSLTYGLAEMFRRVIHDTGVNPEIIIEQI